MTGQPRDGDVIGWSARRRSRPRRASRAARDQVRRPVPCAPGPTATSAARGRRRGLLRRATRATSRSCSSPFGGLEPGAALALTGVWTLRGRRRRPTRPSPTAAATAVAAGDDQPAADAAARRPPLLPGLACATSARHGVTTDARAVGWPPTSPTSSRSAASTADATSGDPWPPLGTAQHRLRLSAARRSAARRWSSSPRPRPIARRRRPRSAVTWDARARGRRRGAVLLITVAVVADDEAATPPPLRRWSHGTATTDVRGVASAMLHRDRDRQRALPPSSSTRRCATCTR